MGTASLTGLGFQRCGKRLPSLVRALAWRRVGLMKSAAFAADKTEAQRDTDRSWAHTLSVSPGSKSDWWRRGLSSPCLG